MADEALIRRTRLRELKLTPKQLAARLGKVPSYYSDLMNLDGKKSFGEKAARTIEQGLELPPFWLDGRGAVPPGRSDADAPGDTGRSEDRAIEVHRALTVIRQELANLHGDESAAAGEALRLLAITPDSERAYSSALAALTLPSGVLIVPKPMEMAVAQMMGRGVRSNWRDTAERVAKGNNNPRELHLLMEFLEKVGIQMEREAATDPGQTASVKNHNA